MLQRIRKAKREESGFTLIELLIVIVILGILAAVVVFAVNGIQTRGTASACKSDLATVATASEAYYALNGSYAATVGALVTANLLKSAPATGNGYTITYLPSGVVNGNVGSGTTNNCT
jgi:prepilin-type N-terminal cleavage/methylation domain-containing protein